MKINRIKKDKDFVILATHVLRNPNLSWAAKGLHSFIMQLPDDWELNVEGLKKFSTIGRDGTASAIKELIQNGYVERFMVKNIKNQFSGYEYNIYETPQTENGKTENGKSVNGLTEYGKTPTIKYEDNTIVLSNKELKNQSSDFEKSQNPPSFSEPTKNKKEVEEKEKKVAPKKEKEPEQLTDEEAQMLEAAKQANEQPSANDILKTPTPQQVNNGVFLELRTFGVARQNGAKSKRMSFAAWKGMVMECIKASEFFAPDQLQYLIQYAKEKKYTSPFFNGYQDFINKNTTTKNGTSNQITGQAGLMGNFTSASGASWFFDSSAGNSDTTRLNQSASVTGLQFQATGFVGASRNNASNIQIRVDSGINTYTAASVTPVSQTLDVFRGVNLYSSVRLTFYSIGEAIDLAKLETRVSNLMTDLNTAIA